MYSEDYQVHSDLDLNLFLLFEKNVVHRKYNDILVQLEEAGKSSGALAISKQVIKSINEFSSRAFNAKLQRIIQI